MMSNTGCGGGAGRGGHLGVVGVPLGRENHLWRQVGRGTHP